MPGKDQDQFDQRGFFDIINHKINGGRFHWEFAAQGPRPRLLLGITALEDKIAQQAIRTVLNQIYEADFVDFSYGFRENRSQHDALDALYVGITSKKINWILDADIKGFFDNINHDMLIELLELRIGDNRVIRLIKKWLKTGYVEDGKRIKQDSPACLPPFTALLNKRQNNKNGRIL